MTGALLTYVLPAASPGTISMIPDRLAGWWLASIAGTARCAWRLSPRRARRSAARFSDQAGGRARGRDRRDPVGQRNRGEPRGTVEASTNCSRASTRLHIDRPVWRRPTRRSPTRSSCSSGARRCSWTRRGTRDLRDAPRTDRELLAAAAAVLRAAGGAAGGRCRRPARSRGPRRAARRDSIARLRELSPDGADFREAARWSRFTPVRSRSRCW